MKMCAALAGHNLVLDFFGNRPSAIIHGPVKKAIHYLLDKLNKPDSLFPEQACGQRNSLLELKTNK